MKCTILAFAFFILYSGFFAVNGALAQGCRADLIDGYDGTILKSLNGSSCKEVKRRCKRKLRRLRQRNPGVYRNAYCDVVENFSYPSLMYQPVQPRVRVYQPVLPRVYQPVVQPRIYQPVQPVQPRRRIFRPQNYVVRSYNRCQSLGIVRCTQEWSNGRVVTEDYNCRWCRGYGYPTGSPCGWKCSFPQQ